MNHLKNIKHLILVSLIIPLILTTSKEEDLIDRIQAERLLDNNNLFRNLEKNYDIFEQAR